MRPLRHSGTPYSGINILMLWAESAQGFNAPIWMTFRQASEFNAHVRKGEKGSLVVYANTSRALSWTTPAKNPSAKSTS
jgi:antirestriction protein ArdC